MQDPIPKLNDAEARVLGVLIEKSLTTPDSYPLSINATLNACNQKSNRDPQVSFVEAEVLVALQGLVPKFLAGKVISAGSRVEKYRHTAVKTLDLEAVHLAILAELMMRGPQAAGELRARVNRMAKTADLAELSSHLDQLIQRGFVQGVAAAPGSRAPRFAQTLCANLHAIEAPSSMAASPTNTQAAPSAADAHKPLTGRVDALEHEVADLRQKLEALLEELS